MRRLCGFLDLRTIIFQNMGVEVISAAAFDASFATVSSQFHRSQLSFVVGRHLALKAVGLGGFARRVVFGAPAYELPVLIFFDDESTFPSAAHRFLLVVLHALGAFEGAQRFVEEFYSNALQRVSSDGPWFLSQVTTGVLKGSPLRGVLVVVVMDPVLRMLTRIVEESAAGLRKCFAPASSGQCCVTYGGSSAMEPVLRVVRSVSGLRLTPDIAPPDIFPVLPRGGPQRCRRISRGFLGPSRGRPRMERTVAEAGCARSGTPGCCASPVSVAARGRSTLLPSFDPTSRSFSSCPRGRDSVSGMWFRGCSGFR